MRNRALGDCGYEAYVQAELAPQGVDDAALRALVAEMLKNPEAYAHSIPGCSTSVFDKDGRQLMEVVNDAPYKRYVATQVAPSGKFITNHCWAALRTLFPKSTFVFLSLSESGDTQVRRYFGNDDVVWVSIAMTPGDMASPPEDTKVLFFYQPSGPLDKSGHYEYALRAAVPVSPHATPPRCEPPASSTASDSDTESKAGCRTPSLTARPGSSAHPRPRTPPRKIASRQ